MKNYIKILALSSALAVCACTPKTEWSKAEMATISAEAPLRVLTIYDKSDSVVLRTPSALIEPELIKTEVFNDLKAKLLATVTDPSQDGVGIAGPQVGILRRVVAVQRFDKEGEPFEVYPNIFVTATRGETSPGPEGCLSIPGWRGDVLRYRDIDIEYTSPKTLKDTTERVQGFSAVIFQHECDHLDGVLYIDKVVEGTLRQRQQ